MVVHPVLYEQQQFMGFASAKREARGPGSISLFLSFAHLLGGKGLCCSETLPFTKCFMSLWKTPALQHTVGEPLYTVEGSLWTAVS